VLLSCGRLRAVLVAPDRAQSLWTLCAPMARTATPAICVAAIRVLPLGTSCSERSPAARSAGSGELSLATD